MGILDDIANYSNPLYLANQAAQMTGIGDAVFKSNLNKDDIEAIAAFFDHTPAKTSDAIGIKNQFNDWYRRLSGVGAYSDDAYAQAKKYRDEFNVANATSAYEREAVKSVINNPGITREQAYGLSPDQKSLGDKIKTALKWVGYGVAGTGAGYIGFKVYKIIRIIL